MLRALSLAMAMTIFLPPLGNAVADDPIEPGANAALKYWQGFSQLPKLTHDEEHKLHEECLKMPLDAHTRETVAKADYAFRMMHRGSVLPRCDWGLSYEDGIELLLPHAAAARTMVNLACLRARIRFEEGHNADAVEDLVDAMILGRQISMDTSSIAVLVNFGVEFRTSETLARYLPKLNAEMVKTLKTRLGTLPPFATAAMGVVPFEEQSCLDWFIRKAKEHNDKESMLTFLNKFCSGPEDSPEQARERGRVFFEGCGGTVEGVVKTAEESRPSYALAAKLMDLPLDQFEKEFQLEEKKRAGNPVFKMLFPNVGALRLSQARADVRRALLATALDIQLDGADALKNHTDPVVGGPFEMVPFEGGYELRSKFKPKDGTTWALSVGQRGK